MVILAAVGAGCGGSRPVVQEVVEVEEPTLTVEELTQMHQQMREQAVEVVEATGKRPGALAYADGSANTTISGVGTIESTWKDGFQDGVFKRSYKDGTPEIEANYKDGLKDGVWKSWHANGKPFEVGVYQAGKRHGKWTTYHENGQVLEEAEYSHDRLQRTYKAFLADGTFVTPAGGLGEAE